MKDLVKLNSTRVTWKFLTSTKFNPWFAMFRRCLVGPIFFETTVDSEVLEDNIIPFISKLEEVERH